MQFNSAQPVQFINVQFNSAQPVQFINVQFNSAQPVQFINVQFNSAQFSQFRNQHEYRNTETHSYDTIREAKTKTTALNVSTDRRPTGICVEVQMYF